MAEPENSLPPPLEGNIDESEPALLSQLSPEDAENEPRPTQDEVELAEDEPPPAPVKKTKSEEDLLNFIMEPVSFMDSDYYVPVIKPNEKMKAPGMTPDETWDFSLKSANDTMSAKTIWISDRDTSKRLGYLNAFGECDHEIMKVHCPCPNACKFSTCIRCHIIFCSNPCIKWAKDMAAGKAPIPVPSVLESGPINEMAESVVPGGSDEGKTNSTENNVPKEKQSVSQSQTKATGKYKNTSKDVNPDAKGTIKNDSASDLNPAQLNENRDRSNSNLPINGPWNPRTSIPYVSRTGHQPVRPPTTAAPTGMSSPPRLNPFSPRGLGYQQQMSRMGGPTHQPRRPLIESGWMNERMRIRVPYGMVNSYPRPPLMPGIPGLPLAFPGGGTFSTFMPTQVIQNIAVSSSQSALLIRPSRMGLGISQVVSGPNNNSLPENKPIIEPGPVPKEEPVRILRDPQGPESIAMRMQHLQSPFARPPADPSIANNLFANGPETTQNKTYAYGGGQSLPHPLGGSHNQSQPSSGSQGIHNQPRQSGGTQHQYNPSGGGQNQPPPCERRQNQPSPSGGRQNRPHPSEGRQHLHLPPTGNQYHPPRVVHNKSPSSERSQNRPHPSRDPNELQSSDKSQNLPRSFTGSKDEVAQNTYTKPKTNFIYAKMDPKSRSQITMIKQEPLICYGVAMTAKYESGFSLFDFWVWNAYGKRDIKFIEELIAEMYLFLPLRMYKKDSFCLAKFFNTETDKNEWYRARVLSCPEDKSEAEVFFIDYGNIETLKSSDIADIPLNLQKYRPCAFGITIGDFKKFEKTTDEELCCWFVNYIAEPDSTFRVTIDNVVDDKSWMPKYNAKIEIRHEGEWLNLTDVLINEGLGEKRRFAICERLVAVEKIPVFPIEKEIQVIIGHVKSLVDFYVIPITNIGQREDIMRNLNDESNSIDIEFEFMLWQARGYICVAKRSDGQWARCKITAIPDDITAEICFLDFGEGACVNLTELKLIPSGLLSVPQLAYRCCLSIFPSDGIWNDEDVQLLKDVQISSQEIYVVAYGWKPEVERNLVEVFFSNVMTGYSKTLQKSKSYREAYPVDLDIRKKLRNQEKEANTGAGTSSSAKSVIITEENPKSSPIGSSKTIFSTSDRDESNSEGCRPPRITSIPIDRQLRDRAEVTAIPVKASPIPIGAVTAFFSENHKNDYSKPAQFWSSTTIPAVTESGVVGPTRQTIDVKPFKDSPMHLTDQGQTSRGSHYSFTVDQIQLPVSLQRLDSKVVFEIKHVFTFNRIYIIPTSIDSDEFMQLQDEITDCCTPCGTKFDAFPPVGSVVIAPFSDGIYYRASIKSIISAEKAEIQFVDLGPSIEMQLSKIKPANQRVMRYPCRGYEVKLSGVEESPELLLWAEFKELMDVSMKRRYQIQSCVGDADPYSVSLIVTNSVKQVVLSDLILKKQVWEWEKLYDRGYKTETDLITHGGWRSPAKVEDAQIACIPLKTELEGEITRFSDEGDVWLVGVKGSTEDCLERDMKVLQNQMKRYAEKVTPSDFFPQYGETVMIFLKDVPELKRLKLRGIGRWNRCYRELSEPIYRNLDLDEVYPMKYASFDEHFVVRRFCSEFFRIPLGIVECLIDGFKPTEAVLEMVREHFKPGTVIKFTAEVCHEDSYVYLIKCPELDERIRLTSANRKV